MASSIYMEKRAARTDTQRLTVEKSGQHDRSDARLRRISGREQRTTILRWNDELALGSPHFVLPAVGEGRPEYHVSVV